MKAIVLAAGRGKRMGVLTENLPKPMIPLSGKPMLEHILDRMRAGGVTDVLLVTGYRAELIEESFRDYPLRVRFVRQTVIEGTARATLLAREFAGQDKVLLTFGDIITDEGDYPGVFAAVSGAEAAIAVRDVDDPWQGASVYASGRFVTRIIEKPPKGTSKTRWNSAGLFALTPRVFTELERVPKSARGEYELTTAFEQILARGGKITIYPLVHEWRDVGRPEDIAQAEDLLE
jgi:NDP-sugar pyrophosphorylase family protein